MWSIVLATALGEEVVWLVPLAVLGLILSLLDLLPEPEIEDLRDLVVGYLERDSLSTSALATKLGLSKRHMRRVLRSLEESGVVIEVGNGVWMLTEHGRRLLRERRSLVSRFRAMLRWPRIA